MNNIQTIKEFENFAFKYFDVYFRERNLKKTLELLDPQVTGFGTGVDERVYSGGIFKELFRRDIESIPLPIDYEFQNYQVNMVSKDVAIFMCQVNIKGEVENQHFSLNHLRETMVLSKKENRIHVNHLHISFPSVEHEEGESYPLKEMEDITKLIEKQVREETMTLMQAYKKLEHIVVHDKLTRVFNRNRLDDLLIQELNRSDRYNSNFSIMLIDIDNFKGINDKFGHLLGDKILVEITNLLKTSIRETDILGRWGGDEFMVILPQTSIEETKKVKESVCSKVKNYTFSNKLHVTVSVGISTYFEDDTFESIFIRADNELYREKNLCE